MFGKPSSSCVIASSRPHSASASTKVIHGGWYLSSQRVDDRVEHDAHQQVDAHQDDPVQVARDERDDQAEDRRSQHDRRDAGVDSA